MIRPASRRVGRAIADLQEAVATLMARSADAEAVAAEIARLEARIEALEAQEPPPTEPGWEILYSVDFNGVGMVELDEAGATWIGLTHNSTCRRRGAPRHGGDWVDPAPPSKIHAKIRAVCSRRGHDPNTYSGIWGIDYEPWIERHAGDGPDGEGPFKIWTDQHKARAVAAFLSILESHREVLPNALIGFYGIPTVKVSENPDDPGERHVMPPEYWADIIKHVDVVMPVHYSGQQHTKPGEIERNTRYAEAAMSYGKPAYAFVHARTVGSRGRLPITIESFIERLQPMYDAGYAGIIYWDSIKLGDTEEQARWPGIIRAVIEHFGSVAPPGGSITWRPDKTIHHLGAGWKHRPMPDMMNASQHRAAAVGWNGGQTAPGLLRPRDGPIVSHSGGSRRL